MHPKQKEEEGEMQNGNYLLRRNKRKINYKSFESEKLYAID